MDCLKPIRIINQCKYVSLEHRDRIVLYVRCGKCAACQQYNRNIWYFRSYYEFASTIEAGGYVLFDCLTYSPKYVPKISNYFDIPKRYDCYCFDYEHLRLFFVRLRRKLRKYDVENNLRYFASTEYGTKLNGTHRPHIHLLLYVTSKDLDSLTLSRAIAECWTYGRTDGVPYKSRKYVLHNTIGNTLQSALRVCQYVSKYVMKDSSYQKTLDKRIDVILDKLYQNWLKVNKYKSFEDWLRHPDGKQLKRNVLSRINQFHRQSLHFGESALRDMDILQIMSDNLLTIPDTKKIRMRIGLPLYYKRKLFYDLVEIDGAKSWIPNELGKEYLAKRDTDVYNMLLDDYQLYPAIIPDAAQLVNYVMYRRGRINADLDSLPMDERIQLQNLVYCYISSCDRRQYNLSFVSFSFLGNKEIGYQIQGNDTMSVEEFISKYVYYDADLEKELAEYQKEKSKNNDSKQRVYDNRQVLIQKYKELGLLTKSPQ